MANKELIISVEGRCAEHQADHSFRVMVLARKIFESELVTASEEVSQNPGLFIEALDWTAVLHDREMTGREDFDHGKKAADRVEEIVGEAVSPE
ncbi:hypothetical protein L6272_02760, partial [Microgenomates group bacterium]|nr:hypothetical protein [Microgenomates group bacterium]